MLHEIGVNADAIPVPAPVLSPKPTPDPLQWYVVQTNAGQEKMANAAIKKLKFELWFPTYVRVVSHARRIEQVERPLFPLYLFARFDVSKPDYGAIQRAIGVHCILGARRGKEQKPIPVPSWVITDLQAAAALNGGHIELEGPPPPRFEHGDKVRILEGPFVDWQGLVDRDHHHRVRVLLDIWGRETALVLDRESLAATE